MVDAHPPLPDSSEDTINVIFVTLVQHLTRLHGHRNHTSDDADLFATAISTAYASGYTHGRTGKDLSTEATHATFLSFKDAWEATEHAAALEFKESP